MRGVRSISTVLPELTNTLVGACFELDGRAAPRWPGEIILSDKLSPVQRRCVLAHEISHAKHHDIGCKTDAYTEQRADVEAAKMLISQTDYVTAEILYGNDECAIARELSVMPWIIRAYKQWLHDSVAI